MKQSHLCLAIAGLCLGVLPRGIGQALLASSEKAPNAPYQRCTPVDSTTAPVATSKKSETKLFHGLRLSGGQLTVPFKIRNKPEHGTFHLTTDVTLGAFVGITQKLSEQKEHFLTIPLTAGLTFININNNNTTVDFAAADEGETNVVPGLTWSSGLILQLDQYNLGLIFGKDYASEVGDQWNYHRKWWWSFGLGFSFTH